ncbi:MAG: anhydro-N-acetylmuramic acid kinase [Zetaproteobacteria bacterium]|nr:MAG: anhydro-N-acetylmuramic acid kinase [Zetaproteobacteria bacterium]
MAPLIIGMMSGTSCDGIDVAIVEFPPSSRPSLRHWCQLALPSEIRSALPEIMQGRQDDVDRVAALDRKLGFCYASAVRHALQEAHLHAHDALAIGCHGQTIRHRPEAEPSFSCQIGCAATLAEMTGITVVSDFRRRDIAAGGQGAPLVPFAHRILFGWRDECVAIVNIGGIANITWMNGDHLPLGFDCGPGNMVMDGLMRLISNHRLHYDVDGLLAGTGKVCEPLLAKLQQLPYFSRTPPKSTGRELFGDDILRYILDWPGISDADRMRTALEWTAWAIANSTRFLPSMPRRWFVCGGGVNNPLLMQRLEELLHPAIVQSTATAGIPPMAVEAVSFAILAKEALLGRPNVLPSVTGAIRATVGGQITPGDNWPELLSQLSAWIR